MKNLALLVLLTISTPGQPRLPQNAGARTSNRTYRVSSELVLINATVLSPHGQPVRGLTASDFRVLEHGIDQKIIWFSEEDVPVSIVFVLDESASMGVRVRESVRAIRLLLDSSGRKDEYALITFADHVEVKSGFGDEDQFDRVLLETQSHGKTALLDAIRLAASVSLKAHNDRRAIVVLSDGGDNHSRYTELEVREKLAETPVQVYAIQIGPRPALAQFVPEVALGLDLLKRIADSAGGRCIEVDNTSVLPGATLQLADEIRSQYVLGFNPGNRVPDHKFHPVRVKLASSNAGRHNTVLWRRGYYDISF